jgi:hypothetical protein
MEMTLVKSLHSGDPDMICLAWQWIHWLVNAWCQYLGFNDLPVLFGLHPSGAVPMALFWSVCLPVQRPRLDSRPGYISLGTLQFKMEMTLVKSLHIIFTKTTFGTVLSQSYAVYCRSLRICNLGLAHLGKFQICLLTTQMDKLTFL